MQITDKKQILIFSIVSAFTMSLALAAKSQSQPIVILEYPTFTNSTQNYSDNVFIQNHDFAVFCIFFVILMIFYRFEWFGF